MQIKTKFSIGDQFWCLENHKLKLKTVESITVDINQSGVVEETYFYCNHGEPRSVLVEGRKIFKDVNEFLNQEEEDEEL
jgi:hypothetical protein